MNDHYPSASISRSQDSNHGEYPRYVVASSPEPSLSECSSDATINPPPAAYYSPIQAQQDQLADFFGAKRGPRTRTAVPPPYSSEADLKEKLPSYDTKGEPETLARFMFLYGFLFPPFWFMGIVILFSELRPSVDWEIGRSEKEQAQLLDSLRTTEVKWAKRCIWALITFFLILSVVVVVAVVAKRR